MYSAAASLWAVTKFLYSSFGVCMLYSSLSNEYIRLFILSKGVEASVVCVTNGRGGGDKTDYYIDPQLLLLTTSRCVIFKTHLAILLLGWGCSTEGRWGQQPLAGRSHWLQAGSHSGLHFFQLSQLEAAQLEAAAPSGLLWFWLWPSLSPADSTAAGIYIYYFITPSNFRLDNMLLFRLFTQMYLWLTHRSRVNT